MTPDSATALRPYVEFSPPPHLRDAVACIWRSHAHTQARQTLILPDGCLDLIWQDGTDPFVVGPMTTPVRANVTTGTTTLGVRFKPGAAAALIGICAAELRDNRASLADLWRVSRVSEFQALALANADFPAVSDAINAVNVLLRQAQPRDRYIADACQWLAHHPGEPASRFFAGTGVSERHGRRRFHEHVGYGPKMLQRILRMQRVLWAAQPTRRTNVFCASGASGGIRRSGALHA